MDRHLKEPLLADLKKKMVLLTGPRQVGKTHLAKDLMRTFKKPSYLNHDVLGDVKILNEQAWPLDSDLLIFDELHKMKGWKAYLKGVFDGRQHGQAILVTGSARMETFRQSGESLAGRYYHFHLLPLSVRELDGQMPPREALDRLNRLGGFPEPLLSDSEKEAARWRTQYYSDLIREDILEIGRVGEIRAMSNLFALLRGRVGSPLSYSSLARDLQISQPTVKRYIEILEALYVVFLVRPFHRNVARAILKEPKLYFYDSGLVQGDEGVRLENTVALCLLKHAAFLKDVSGRELSLHYLRTKDAKEVDFALSEEGLVKELMEVKLSSSQVSPSLRHFKERFFPDAAATLLVANLAKERRDGPFRVRPAADRLLELMA